MKDIGKKIILFIFLYLIYQNTFYIILVPEIYSIPIYVIYLITAYLLTLGDTLIRSIPEEKKAPKIFDILILSMLLSSPFLLIGAFFENRLIISQILPFWDNIIITYLGFSLYLSGGLLTIVARAQLGRFGTGELITEEDHQLFTQGVYKYIRNPMYSGALIATIGFCLVFRCIIILIGMFIYYFLVFRMRIIEEERILTEKFGEKFEDYKKRTKRLIPFLY
ncbi:MAG: methyltransferase family protein [Promethearchaeota archaeon]|jgi:protein-S-isoprenylcysteine O-methyltransferase Ste14